MAAVQPEPWLWALITTNNKANARAKLAKTGIGSHSSK
jgi:hypothetical protein